MSKCFISYRHVKPDEDLAQFLEKFLNDKGYKPFRDTKISPGKNWAEEIEKHLKSSDFFIVLLSENSIESDMVREEVKIAHKLLKEQHEKYCIIPIRVDYKEDLPYDLGSWLDPIQYIYWKPGDSYEKIAEDVLEVIQKNEKEPEESENFSMKREPLKIESETGTVKFDSSFYIKRSADYEVMEEIKKDGAIIIVKGPGCLGKSSLLARVYAEAKKLKIQSCYIDFHLLDDAHLTSLDTLFRYLALKISQDFETSIKPADFWDDTLPVKHNFTEFIEVLLKDAQAAVLIILDLADRLFECSFRDDFFSTIKVWSNLMYRDYFWKNLSLIIAHSTNPYLWIQSIDSSPFNVGTLINLEDFDFQQVAELNDRYGKPLKKEDEIHELMKLIGGHPYLAQLALDYLKKNNYSLSKLKKVATADDGPFSHHLRYFTWRLLKEEKVKESLRQVLREGKCDNDSHSLRLMRAGLVKCDMQKKVQMRCQLYHDYFMKHLIK